MAEALDVADPAEKGFDIEQGRLLGEVRPGLMGGILQHHAEVLEERSRRAGVDSTQTLVAIPVNTRWRMPRLRKMLSSGVLKKPL